MNRYGQPHRKLTIWLGSDDGSPDGMEGYGWNVHREDSMVSVGYAAKSDDGEDLEVFILPDLFPAIRRAMDAADSELDKKGRKA